MIGRVYSRREKGGIAHGCREKSRGKKAIVKLLELSEDDRVRDLNDRRDIEVQKKWAAKQMQFDIEKNLLKR